MEVPFGIEFADPYLVNVGKLKSVGAENDSNIQAIKVLKVLTTSIIKITTSRLRASQLLAIVKSQHFYACRWFLPDSVPLLFHEVIERI